MSEQPLVGMSLAPDTLGLPQPVRCFLCGANLSRSAYRVTTIPMGNPLVPQAVICCKDPCQRDDDED